MRRFLAAVLLCTSALGAAPAGIAQPAPSPDGEIALQFEWKSTKPYAGQFHDVVRFDAAPEGSATAGSWVRLVNVDEPINEDRVSLMLEDPARPVPGFATQGCYVTCHSDMNDMPEQTVDARHYVLPHEGRALNSFGLDMWHWRGARSGPMGFAEDTWVRTHNFGTGAQGRQRDAAPVKPTNWVNSGGDNLHENQPFGGAQLTWQGTPLPRFVFDPERSGFDHYFLAVDGEALTEVDDLKTIANDQYRSQLVIYQDLGFDADDKVNSIDVRYLLFRAGAIPDPGHGAKWLEFWEQRTGVSTAEQASTMLDDIVAHVEDGVMINRVVGFIYPSNQHDISSTRSFEYDAQRGTWKVTLYRALNTSDDKDVDLTALVDGQKYNLAFAVHDIVIDDGFTHHISLPVTLGKTGDIEVSEVPNTRAVDWSGVSEYKATLFQPGTMSLQHLLDPDEHRRGGADGVAKRQACLSCHTTRGLALQSRPSVPEELLAANIPVTVRAVYGFNHGPAAAERVEGKNRFDVAVNAARVAYPDWAGVKNVVLASGDDRAAADPLAAAGLCWAYDAPLLLVGATSTPEQVKAAIKEIVDANGPVALRVVGGQVSVPNARLTEIVSHVGAENISEVDRIRATGDRYDNAAAIATRMASVAGADPNKSMPSVALFANGADRTKFFDALALSPISAATGAPILLVKSDSVPAATAAALASLQPSTRIVAGGSNTVRCEVVEELSAARWAGRTRFDTAVVIAGNAIGAGWVSPAQVGVAATLPDALTGGSVLGKQGGVLVLTDGRALSAATGTWLTTHKDHIRQVYVFGGPNSLSDGVRASITETVQ